MDFSPSIYEHAAQLIGVTPWEASRDGELLFRAHAAAYRFYRHHPIMPGIDIYNLEAEAYGGRIERPTGNGIPAISESAIGATAQIAELPPLDPQRDGRIPMQIAVAERLRDTFPGASIRVPVAGPFSIASNLLGFETLVIDCVIDPDRVAASLMHLVDGQLAFAQEIQSRGLDVAFFESAACPPMLSPDQFRAVELPALQAVMKGIGEIVGHAVPCIIGGDTTPILPAMLETGTSYLICPFETDQSAFLSRVAHRSDVHVRVNCDLRIIAGGSRSEIRAEADRVVRLISDRPNTSFGTGALPYETRPENVIFLTEYLNTK